MMKNGMNNLMKQAQMMQDKMKQAQNELADMTVSGSANNGAVKIIMTGQHKVKSVHILEEAFVDREILEDLVLLAIQDAVNQVEKMSADHLGKFMPAGMKLPF